MASRVPAAAFALVALMFLTGVAVAQPALNWSADDGARIDALATGGRRIEGAHMVVWHPPSLRPSDADRILRRLDPAIAALWTRVGAHDWQAVPKGRITFYLSDDSFVSHASGRGAVFVPMARVSTAERRICTKPRTSCWRPPTWISRHPPARRPSAVRCGSPKGCPTTWRSSSPPTSA